VDISFDPAKNARNVDVHGISLERATDFGWDQALHVRDDRREYGELRFKAYGLIESRMHVLVYTPRDSRMHVISLRKANRREVRRYGAKAKEEEIPLGS
jgi:uncharacterized protein